MTRNIIDFLLISAIVVLCACAKCPNVVHTIEIPHFNTEQKKIAKRFIGYIYTHVSNPESYFIKEAKQNDDGSYFIELYKLSALQSYYQESNCGGVMYVDGNVWLIFDREGKLIKTNLTSELISR